jgi:hypothetical protein
MRYLRGQEMGTERFVKSVRAEVFGKDLLQEELLIFEGLQRGGFDKWVLFCIT